MCVFGSFRSTPPSIRRKVCAFVFFYFIFFNKDCELIRYEVTVSVLARAQHTQCCSNREKCACGEAQKNESKEKWDPTTDDDGLLCVYENGWIVLKKYRDSRCTATVLFFSRCSHTKSIHSFRLLLNRSFYHTEEAQVYLVIQMMFVNHFKEERNEKSRVHCRTLSARMDPDSYLVLTRANERFGFFFSIYSFDYFITK